MEITIKTKYNIKDNVYYLEVKDDQGIAIPYASNRLFDSEYEAEIAAGIVHFMFSKINSSKEFDSSEFGFNLKAVFRLLGTPGKW